jgi:hypothetical protein
MNILRHLYVPPPLNRFSGDIRASPFRWAGLLLARGGELGQAIRLTTSDEAPQGRQECGQDEQDCGQGESAHA